MIVVRVQVNILRHPITEIDLLNAAIAVVIELGTFIRPSSGVILIIAPHLVVAVVAVVVIFVDADGHKAEIIGTVDAGQQGIRTFVVTVDRTIMNTRTCVQSSTRTVLRVVARATCPGYAVRLLKRQ